mgnify:FL=1
MARGDYRWVKRAETFPRNVSTWWQDVLWWSAVGFAVGVGAGWLIWVYVPVWRVEMILFAGLGLMWIGAVNAVDWVIRNLTGLRKEG